MELERTGLSGQELTELARVSGRDVDQLGDELRRRPWAIHDVLGDPDTVASVFESEGLVDSVSPFVLFAVLARHAADDLLDRPYVNEWIAPNSRLPVFDVEPLCEFAFAPGRVLFLARLLTSMVHPVCAPVPVPTTDPWELAGWLDAVDEQDRVRLLRRMGDVSLFIAGVHADATGVGELGPTQIDQLARSLGISEQDAIELVEADSTGAGPETLERVGARWYQESRRIDRRTPPIVGDIAERIHEARRFLTHLADEYLATNDLSFPFAA